VLRVSGYAVVIAVIYRARPCTTYLFRLFVHDQDPPENLGQASVDQGRDVHENVTGHAGRARDHIDDYSAALRSAGTADEIDLRHRGRVPEQVGRVDIQIDDRRRRPTSVSRYRLCVCISTREYTARFRNCTVDRLGARIRNRPRAILLFVALLNLGFYPKGFRGGWFYRERDRFRKRGGKYVFFPGYRNLSRRFGSNPSVPFPIKLRFARREFLFVLEITTSSDTLFSI